MRWIEFKNHICTHLSNPKIQDFLIRFIGYDYAEESEVLDVCLSSAYHQMPEEELKNFESELLALVL